MRNPGGRCCKMLIASMQLPAAVSFSLRPSTVSFIATKHRVAYQDSGMNKEVQSNKFPGHNSVHSTPLQHMYLKTLIKTGFHKDHIRLCHTRTWSYGTETRLRLRG